jgi:hypothetical protein
MIELCRAIIGIEKLHAETGHGKHCSNPDCRASTSGPQGLSPRALNIGVASHITAAAPGGPRYDPALTSEQRCHQDNGIWLCQNCGKLVDNDAARYDAALLRAWKVVAENRALNSIGKTARPLPETDTQRKLRAILPWKDKTITLTLMTPPGNGRILIGPKLGSSFCKVIDCDEFVVTIRSTDNAGTGRAIPLSKIEISFDTAHNWLELQEH